MNISKTICKKLKEFEKKNNTKVLLAVESGSRAWGFASTDSDYDVRFVFIHQKKKYLELKKPEDSYNWIDKENNIDYEGFDIYKFYDLLFKSNMNIIDWVQNGLVYEDSLRNKADLRKIIEENFNRNTYISHNYGLCSKNYHKYFEVPRENEPTAKRYVYCIRAILSAQYCARMGKLAPLNFYELLDKSLLSEVEKEGIYELLTKKKKAREKKWYRNTFWDSWIKTRLNGEHVRSDIENNPKEYYTALNAHLLRQFKEE